LLLSPLKNCIAKCRKSQDILYTCINNIEPTVQQDETRQPPPPDPCEGIEDPKPMSGPAEQQKEDITFLTFLDKHFGHSVSFGSAWML
jgi:hypothetical protein